MAEYIVPDHIANRKVENDSDVAAEQKVKVRPEEIPLPKIKGDEPRVIIDTAERVVQIGPEQDT